MDYFVRDSLARIAFSSIGGVFWRGKYGEHEVIMRQDTCYFNGTRLCAVNNKNIKHWMNTKQTQDLILCCESEMKSEQRQFRPFEEMSSSVNYSATSYVVNENVELAGLYIHPYLAPHLVSWISSKFAISVSKIVNMFLSRDYMEQYTSLLRYNSERYSLLEANLIEVQKEKAESERANQNQIMAAESQHAQRKIELVKTKDQMRKWSTTHSLTILNINDPEANYPYYVIRCKRRGMSTAVGKIKKRHPNAFIIYSQKYVLNGVNLFERLKKANIVQTRLNYFKHDLSVNSLIEKIREFSGDPITPSKTIYNDGHEYVVDSYN